MITGDQQLAQAATEQPGAQRIGFVASGDVELFFRRFGQPGATPLLILHGANYYDSRDWVEIAQALASDREVVAYDARGYGQSSWSPSRAYSVETQLLDIRRLLDHLGWQRTSLIGHSRGGSFALRFALDFPDRVAGAVLVDYSPGQTPGRPRIEPRSVGRFGAIYESLEQAHAATSRNPRELDSDAGRARVESIFAPRDGGWVNIRRDPAFQTGGTRAPVDLWAALAGLVDRRQPALVVRGTQSAVYDEAALSRLAMDFPSVAVVDVDSGHDIPGTAPTELVGAVRGEFLR